MKNIKFEDLPQDLKDVLMRNGSQELFENGYAAELAYQDNEDDWEDLSEGEQEKLINEYEGSEYLDDTALEDLEDTDITPDSYSWGVLEKEAPTEFNNFINNFSFTKEYKNINFEDLPLPFQQVLVSHYSSQKYWKDATVHKLAMLANEDTFSDLSIDERQKLKDKFNTPEILEKHAIEDLNDVAIFHDPSWWNAGSSWWAVLEKESPDEFKKFMKKIIKSNSKSGISK